MECPHCDIIENKNKLDTLESRLVAQAAEIKGLREALEFYAERDNWKFQSYSSEIKDTIKDSDLGCKSFNGENNFADYACPSGGRRARETLAKKEWK
jgi:hypothetical protein